MEQDDTPIKIDHRVKIKDWSMTYDQYMLVHKPKGMTQSSFSKQLGVNEKWLSVKFNEVEAERTLATAKTKMPGILLKALENVQAGLEEQADYSPSNTRTGISPQFKSQFALGVAEKISDRLGMSPQSAIINMTQNQQTNIQIAPIFHTDLVGDSKRMLGSDAD